ncbi:MAG: TIR domain-containing protein [Chloroflexi bacterium]|nr:TIR domain-containing protein [Chloroflexota bacterium]
MSTASPDKTRIFISYARADGEPFAIQLRDQLQIVLPDSAIWLDHFELHGGEDWWLQIKQAIDRADFLVLVMTRRAVESPNVGREWRYAKTQGVVVYPVIADPDIEMDRLPRWMSTAHWYNLERQWTRFVDDLREKHSVTRVPFMAAALPINFVERPAEFNYLKAALRDRTKANTVAISSALTGAGGFGKTTLAIALCHDEDIQADFHGGILWVTLGENPNILENLNLLITALNPAYISLGHVEEAVLKLGDLLADRDCLMVIDDVWDAAHLRPFLRNGSRCVRLVTTRLNTVLPADSHKIRVDAMQPGEAIQLLGQGILATSATLPKPDLRSLTQRLGEWPLLLTLANGAMRRRMETGESPAQAAAWVEKALTRKGFSALDDPGSQTGRHRAAAATLQVSLELLTNTEFHRYIRLAIFHDDVDVPLAALERLWGLDDFDTDDLCGRFFGLSLLLDFDRAAHTIRLHDVVRAFLRAEHQAALAEWNAAFLEKFIPLASTNNTLDFAWADLPDHTSYLWDWLAYHLVEAGHHEALIQTVQDLRYLAHKTYMRDAVAAERDIIEALKIAPQDTMLQILRRNFTNAAHFLKLGQTRDGIVLTLLSRLQHVEELHTLCLQLENSLIPPFVMAWNSPPDLPHPALIRTIAGHRSEITDCKINSQGTWIVSASGDGTLKLWDVETGQERLTLKGHTRGINCCAISPDDTWIVSGADDETLKLWDVETGQERLTLKGHTRGISCCAISPDGTWIVSASADSTLKVWEVATGQEIRTLKGHLDFVTACVISADGTWVASASKDNTLKVWEVKDGGLRFTLVGHLRRVMSCAAIANSHHLVSVSKDTMVKVWDVDNGHEIKTMAWQSSELLACAVSPNGQWVGITSQDQSLIVKDIVTEMTQLSVQSLPSTAICCAIEPQNQWIATGSRDGRLRLWATSLRENTSLSVHHGNATGCAISPDGAWVVATSDDNWILTVWDFQTATPKQVLRSHAGRLLACSISPDGQWFVSASGDQNLKVWDAHTYQELFTLVAHSDRVNGCTISPDAFRIVSVGGDGKIVFWEAASGKKIRVLNGHKGAVSGCAISPDNQLLLSSSYDKTLMLWDCVTGERLSVIEGHLDGVLNCAFHPDGHSFLSVSADKTLKLWDTVSRRLISTLQGHSNRVTASAFSPDGRWIASVCTDQTLRIWEVATLKTVSILAVDGRLWSCAWHPDGEHLIVGGDKGLYWLHLVQ